MRRLIRNIQGEPRPLIMHRRLQWLRAVDEWVRYRVRRALGLAYRRPRYLTPRCSPEQEMRRLWIKQSRTGTTPCSGKAWTASSAATAIQPSTATPRATSGNTRPTGAACNSDERCTTEQQPSTARTPPRPWAVQRSAPTGSYGPSATCSPKTATEPPVPSSRSTAGHRRVVRLHQPREWRPCQR